MINELIRKNRSYRRFYGEEKITVEQLRELVDIARNTPSAANRQPIKYKLVCDEKTNAEVYECVGWAGYYKDWDGPVDSERPSAYIVLVTPEELNASVDIGIVSQTIMLAAVEKGLGGCMLGNIKRDRLVELLEIPEGYKIDLCLALGKPKENVVLEDIPGDGDYKYYRDDEQTQHVPKKCLEDILL